MLLHNAKRTHEVHGLIIDDNEAVYSMVGQMVRRLMQLVVCIGVAEMLVCSISSPVQEIP
jgi:hypothetical protein